MSARSLGRVGAFLALAAVGASSAAAQAPATEPARGAGPVLRVAIDATQGVNFRAAVDRDAVYVGEQVTYQVGVFLDDDTRHRLRRNPEFTPPEPRAMLAYDLPSPPGPTAVRTENGRRYEVHVFQRALFPISPGRTTIPPARLSYALPLSNSFFAREERRSARADSLVVDVRPLPAAGRPADFRGAVGRFDVAVRVDSAAARVGDPLLLTVRVRGQGNVKLLPRPPLALAWAQAVPAGERVSVDSGRMTVTGFKDFSWLVTPQRAGDAAVPEVRYPYFDPADERYEIAVAPPLPVRVQPGTLAAGGAAADGEGEAVPPLPLRPAFRGELPPVLPQRPWFWAATFLLPVPALAIGAVRRERRRARRSAAQELRALAGRAEVPAAVVRRRFASALAERVPLGGGALTSGRALIRSLRRAGVTRETAADVAALVAELDAAAFGSSEPPAPVPPVARAEEVLARVGAEARHRFAPPLWGWLLVVAAAGALGGGTLAAGGRAPADAAEAFSGGVRLYDARRYEQAAAAFGEVTRLAPRSADAWANRGTAAWAANDTAAAAEGWQRAVRLEPLAADVRERLDLLPGTQLGGAAWVPPAPVSLAAGAALAFWAAACGWAAWRVWRRRTARSTGPVVLATAAAAWAGLAWAGEHARTARELDVVRDGGESRVSPALGAEPGPSLRTGEVVRVLARREAWARVAVDGDREAWVAAARLAPLRAD